MHRRDAICVCIGLIGTFACILAGQIVGQVLFHRAVLNHD